MYEKQKEIIYSEYRNKIFGYIQSKIRNVDIAEDLTSDVFVKIYEKLDQFDEKKASLSTWIYLVTRNTLIDYYRTKKVSYELTEQIGEPSSVEEEVCNKAALNDLAEGLKNLGERERNIIILHFYSGKTLREISDMMGISYSYVKLLLYRSYGNLKRFLRP